MKVSFDEKMTEIRAHREAWTKSRKQTQARRARARPPARLRLRAAPRALWPPFTGALRSAQRRGTLWLLPESDDGP